MTAESISVISAEIPYFAFTNNHRNKTTLSELVENGGKFYDRRFDDEGTHPEGDSQRFLERRVLLSFHVCVVDQCGDGFLDATVVRGNPV